MVVVLCCLFEAIFLPISTDKNPFESFYVELNFRKKKWLLNCSYNPNNNNNIESRLNCLSRSIDSLSSKYENLILLDDFNSYMDDSPMICFCETYNLRNHVKHVFKRVFKLPL